MNKPNEPKVNPYTSPQVSASKGTTWVQLGGHSLRKVALGISFVYYGIVLALLAIIVMVVAAVLANVAGVAVVMMVGTIVAAGMIIVASILVFVGPIICLAVPAETRSKGMLWGSVICQLLNLAIGVGVQIVLRQRGNPMSKLVGANEGGNDIADEVIQLTGSEFSLIGAQFSVNIIGCVAFALFILFIKRLAEFIARDDLAKRAKTVLNGWIYLNIVFFANMIVFVLAKFVGILILIAALIATIVVLIMYAKLIESMKKALTVQDLGTL